MTTDESEELDTLAMKYHDALIALRQQRELNAQLMCEVKRLQSENVRLSKWVKQNDRTLQR